MHLVERQQLGEAWAEYMGVVLRNGRWLPDDREPILEASAISIEIREIQETDPLVREFGDPHIIDIYTRKMFSRELIAELSSTYGARLFDWEGVDQVSKAVERLSKKWWSKSAAIGLISPTETMPRVPCLINLVPLVRSHELVLNAMFRSQNSFNSYGNFIGLHVLQRHMARQLDIQTGSLRVFVAAPHIYRSDIARAAIIAGVDQGELPKCPL